VALSTYGNETNPVHNSHTARDKDGAEIKTLFLDFASRKKAVSFTYCSISFSRHSLPF